MPAFGNAEDRLAGDSRAACSPGSLKQAMTKAEQSLSRWRTMALTGATTLSTWACVSMPGGPSFRVTHSRRAAGDAQRRHGGVDALGYGFGGVG